MQMTNKVDLLGKITNLNNNLEYKIVGCHLSTTN